MTAGSIARVGDASPLPARLRGGVVAIGNFDGVHRGHQDVIALAKRRAHALGAPLVVLTFEPHPRTVFAPERPVPRLTPSPLKARLLGALGADCVVERPFDRAVAGWSPEAFVEAVLVREIGAREIVVGADFRFGARRAGDIDFLARAGEAHGFGLTLTPDCLDEGGEAISSSRVRAALARGAVDEAAGLLGYRWSVDGTIEHGRKVGRTLGYPTANMVLPFPSLLAHGIYAVRVRRADGTLHDGAASYGRRPTFDDGAPLFETFLFGFSGDLYGESVQVSPFAFIRGEERFDGIEALKRRMNKDAEEAQAVLSGARPLSALDAAVAF